MRSHDNVNKAWVPLDEKQRRHANIPGQVEDVPGFVTGNGKGAALHRPDVTRDFSQTGS